MTVVGLALLVLAGLIIYEATKGLSSSSAAANTASTVSPSSATGLTPTSAASGPSGSNVQHNVTTLATWARQNNIDPRVALALLAHEGAYNGGVPVNTADPNGGSAGPLQINGVHAPGGQLTAQFAQWASSIENDISVIGGRWLGSIQNVSFSQFQSDPAKYTLAAQGGDWYPANNQQIWGTVQGWCQQYGVC
jgi:hypothetical protein